MAVLMLYGGINMLWENLREEEFKDAIKSSCGLCILPVGCLEKHGQHLPVGTDVIHITEIAKKASEIEPVCVFPTMYFGEKTGSGEFLGTIIFSPELRLQILKETCSEIYRNGFDKILIYNGHGGNQSMISYFSRSVLYEKNNYSVFDYSLGADFATPKKILNQGFSYLTSEDRKVLQGYIEQKKKFGHADFIETGWVYGVRPETVRLDKAEQEDCKSTHRFDEFTKRRINSPFSWMADFPNSYEGDMHEGMNERIARAMVEFSVNKLVEVIRFLKEETISVEYKAEWLDKQKPHGAE
ncbi:MAG: creatininase family protein [Ruminococcaceae bacterium]|nr:creatininase family protein [Oscillospiraceae bacterium]